MSKHTLWKTLSCDLTLDEISKYSQELARITGEQSEIEAEKKEVMSNFAAKLNKCVADGRVLARKIITKKEDRQVECDLDFDYAKGMVYTVRADTGVTIDQRKLTDDERQERPDFEGEQDKQQADEEKREEEYLADCQAMDRDEHNPDEPDITICGNVNCFYSDQTEGNGCKQYEEVWTCKQAFQEIATCGICGNAGEIIEDGKNNGYCDCQYGVALQEQEAENTRRDGICKTWTECEYKDICFTEQNDVLGICFTDEPHRLAEITKTGEVAPSLTELCEQCKNTHPSCADCCSKCKTPCSLAQNCRWPGAEVTA